ncbi:LacI family transcriptional regulator [Saccharopolyspora erythraea NRRL 2338]|uniref:Sugar-binding transcriptional regulator, LacI family n=2 Tax=Saccharopolyspora erythraea TaxID=1836 RepID=A4FGB3_SACEN|nr:LacI family DNA-binding transcriptional regulator [Saccharopolyspora erythraea]EQD84867.1 LacI family transcriptional regulator [Saccharopolyspora erythraea D]PFG96792.1 LacI family transcriptional regulator [Saccharopolyspora erythraea NRRL 2338]QRK87036.1 LacI family DNA-binding transcriptional regulator [Saccharopolyspora erythraea]CAM03088.1 sugar-binding transcriptional regulator, LacI family [Saccharopolyspora erythraea NRRL 2338]
MEQAPRRPTIKDVARSAGVSYQTVSRAMNDKADIDPRTKRRVLAAADALGYRPSRFARGLVNPGSTTLGLVVPDVGNPFFPEVIAGVIGAASRRGWHVVVVSGEGRPEQGARLLSSLTAQVDAVVGYLDRTDTDEWTARVPLVLLDQEHPVAGSGAVSVDVDAGVRAGVGHLLDSGHEVIGMIDCDAGCDRSQRRRTFLDVLRERGTGDAETYVERGEQSADGGAAAARRLLARHPEITAVFAFNDLVAVGALRALRTSGLRVPQDCAVLGFDGLALGEWVEPRLTTVRIDKHRLGELAMQEVGRLLEEPSAKTSEPAPVLRPELVIRESA